MLLLPSVPLCSCASVQPSSCSLGPILYQELRLADDSLLHVTLGMKTLGQASVSMAWAGTRKVQMMLMA